MIHGTFVQSFMIYSSKRRGTLFVCSMTRAWNAQTCNFLVSVWRRLLERVSAKATTLFLVVEWWKKYLFVGRQSSGVSTLTSANPLARYQHWTHPDSAAAVCFVFRAVTRSRGTFLYSRVRPRQHVVCDSISIFACLCPCLCPSLHEKRQRYIAFFFFCKRQAFRRGWHRTVGSCLISKDHIFSCVFTRCLVKADFGTPRAISHVQ